MFDKYELDDRGILPYDGEKEAMFVKRGNAILDASAKLSGEQMMRRTGRCYGYHRADYFNFGSNGSFDYIDHNKALRREALAYVLAQYGMDLTWVRFFEIVIDPGMHAISDWMNNSVSAAQKMSNFPAGFVIRQDWRSNNMGVVVPVIFIREITQRVIIHELIHAGRADILENYRWFLSVGSDRDTGMYEERVAHNRFYRSDFFYLFSFNRQKRNIYRARRRLEKAFGDKAGYVFVRLNYSEIMRSLFEARNPMEFIKEQSRDNSSCCRNLKFKIMADKLGL